MQTIALGKTALVGSRLAYGCWRLGGSEGGPVIASDLPGKRAVHSAVDAGYSIFDLADIYCGGRSETIFGSALRESPSLRNHLVIATKCGIRIPGSPEVTSPYRYDFSAAYIEGQVEGSLRRMGIETIDLLMLHRPDYLMQPCEIANTFTKLRQSGKVREFGVSNFRPSQVASLQSAVPWPLAVNQVELSLMQLAALEDGTLDHCLATSLTPMAWSPLAGGKLGEIVHGLLPSQREYDPARVLPVLDRLAAEIGTTRSRLAIAWLLRHPAGVVPVVGSTNPDHIRSATKALEMSISREDWYRLLHTVRPVPLP